MRHMVRASSILLIGIALLAGSLNAAMAQSIVKAIYRVSLTDPASGNVYYTDRTSLRSWTTEQRCEDEKTSFSGFHTDRISGLNIVNPDGTPLTVEMASIHCVVVRE